VFALSAEFHSRFCAPSITATEKLGAGFVVEVAAGIDPVTNFSLIQEKLRAGRAKDDVFYFPFVSLIFDDVE
jgi:hypothetical protein